MSRGSANQFLVDGIANIDRRNFNWRCRSLTVKSGAANEEETLVVIDITPVARSTFGALADPHANGGLFVGSVTAPVGLPANAAWSIFGNSTKAVDSNSLSLRKVDDPALVGIGNMD